MLVIDNLSTGYGNVNVLHNLSLQLSAGKCIALIGANGAGKTTLQSTISGIIHPKEGNIYFKNLNITRYEPDARINLGIATSPEGRRIFQKMSVYENLLLGALVRGKNNFAHNLERTYSLFPILKKRADAKAGTLSGGEQQMLAIARALISEPDLLLLDEPSLGLAPLVVREIFTIIKELRDNGTAILLAEQNATAALKIADTGIVIAGGVFRRQAAASSLLHDQAVRDMYLGG